ncbi:MAG: hypothetical protein JO161_00765 [Planctomycetaceae bacterium]|nr:hypothetical protein [Planctomycetaceae bacterium]
MISRTDKSQTPKQPSRLMTTKQERQPWADRPVGRASLVLIIAFIVCAPWLLFFDPISLPGHPHIARDPAAIYRLQNDDFAYVAASLTLGRMLSNLFTPHNTHIVPAWRVLTWMMVSMAGSLERLPQVLAIASYGILAAVMLLAGRLVARETGRTGLGLAAMSAVGTTSLMLSAAAWYSAGQTLWAGFGILASLWYAQCFRRSRSVSALLLAALAAMTAGWFWTIGHLAGPVAAIYLWSDGRKHCRWAAAAPLAGTFIAVIVGLGLGAGKIDSSMSFHGRTAAEAARPIAGLWHTAQAIPENLVFVNLGLRVRTTPAQGLVLTTVILACWLAGRWRQGGLRTLNSLETAGATLALGSYFVEWTVRGYLDYYLLRTLSLPHIVPWYDTIPQIGAVLFVIGWIAGPRWEGRRPAVLGPRVPLTRVGAGGILGLVAVLMTLNGPRVDLLWRKTAPPLAPIERTMYPIVPLQSMRASALLLDRAEWQRQHLRRLDQAQQEIITLGISFEACKAAFGRIDVPDLPLTYDGIGLLEFPARGRLTAADQVRRALERYLERDSEPRPRWLPPKEEWPPPFDLVQLRQEVYGDE